jgi:hypothetical protein
MSQPRQCTCRPGYRYEFVDETQPRLGYKKEPLFVLNRCAHCLARERIAADAIRVAEWAVLSCYDEDAGECNNCGGLRFQHKDDCPLLSDEMYQLAEKVLTAAREAGIGDGDGN